MTVSRWKSAGLLLLVGPWLLALQQRLTRPELCDLSEHVVFGEVTDLETRWTADPGGGIERIAHVAVLDSVRGPPAGTVEIVLPGGQIGDVGHWVEDVPKLLVNARYLLFVGPAMDGTLQVVGGDQGAVRITKAGARIGEPLEQAMASVEVCRAPR